MKTQVIACRWWDYPYQAQAGAKKLLPFMTALINTLKRSSSSILLIFAEKLLNCSLKIMVSVQLQTGEVFVKMHQHFSHKNKLSFVVQNLNWEIKRSCFFFLIFFSHFYLLANLSFLSFFPSMTNLHREQKVLLECLSFCGLQNQSMSFWCDSK